MPFGVSPAAAAVEQASDAGFPNFIQFQQGGSNLGGPDADTVNFASGITATRGVGENENVLTVSASGGGGGGGGGGGQSAIQFQSSEVNLGGPDADTLNFHGGVTTATRSGNTINVDTPMPLWHVLTGVVGNYVVQQSDFGPLGAGFQSADSGLVFELPSDFAMPLPLFTSFIVLDLSVGTPITFVAGSGATLKVRAGLIAESNGTNAIVTMIKTAANTWALAGDLAAG